VSADGTDLAELACSRLDGDLADDEWRRLLDAHGPPLTAALQREAAMRDALRGLPRVPAPAAVREAVLAHVAAPAVRTRAQAWWWTAGVLAAACIGAALSLQWLMPEPPASRPSETTVAVREHASAPAEAPGAKRELELPADRKDDVRTVAPIASESLKQPTEAGPAVGGDGVGGANELMAKNEPPTSPPLQAKAMAGARATAEKDASGVREQAQRRAPLDSAAAAKPAPPASAAPGRVGGKPDVKPDSDAEVATLREEAETYASGHAPPAADAPVPLEVRQEAQSVERSRQNALARKTHEAAAKDQGEAVASDVDRVAGLPTATGLAKLDEGRDRRLAGGETGDGKGQDKRGMVTSDDADAPTNGAVTRQLAEPAAAPSNADAATPAARIELAVEAEPPVAVLTLLNDGQDAVQVQARSLRLEGLDASGTRCWERGTGQPADDFMLSHGRRVLRIELSGELAPPTTVVRLRAHWGDAVSGTRERLPAADGRNAPAAAPPPAARP
jgi:hypothetical protein